MPEPASLLAHAVRNDKAEQVAALLRQGADIFERTPRGTTLLAEVIATGERAGKSRPTSVSARLFATAQTRIAELFLAHARSLPAERFSLADAIAIRNLEAVQINLAREPPGEENAAAYAGVLAQSVQRDDADMVKLLLAAGVSADARVPATNRVWDNAPMLGLAAAGGHAAAMRLLLQHGADVNARMPGRFGTAADATPLMLAAHTSSLAAVKLLVEAGADLGAQDAARATALDHAQRAGGKRIIAYLGAAFEKHDAAAGVDLWAAAKRGIAYRVRALLAEGADPDQRDAQGRTALMLAAAAGQSEVVKLLCEAGADVHAVDADVAGDLWAFAFTWPKADVVACLIRHGLDPAEPRGRLGPPLLPALRIADKEIIRIMLAHGADVLAPVPAEVLARVRAQRAKAVAVRRSPRARTTPPPEIGDTCSVLDFARYFSSTELYELLAGSAGVEPAAPRFHDRLRAMLKSCAGLADAPFLQEAARLGEILRAKPQPWKRRRGVIHYVSPLVRALSAHYGAVPTADARGFATVLLQRLQAEVAERGYTLIYTGLSLAHGGPVRLLLFPLDEPLATLAACGTNAANFGLGTRNVVDWCEDARETHPLTVIGAGFDFVELGFAAPITDSVALTRRLAEFCPDLQVRADDARAVTAFAEELSRVRRCFLWWD